MLFFLHSRIKTIQVSNHILVHIIKCFLNFLPFTYYDTLKIDFAKNIHTDNAL